MPTPHQLQTRINDLTAIRDLLNTYAPEKPLSRTSRNRLWTMRACGLSCLGMLLTVIPVGVTYSEMNRVDPNNPGNTTNVNDYGVIKDKEYKEWQMALNAFWGLVTATSILCLASMCLCCVDENKSMHLYIKKCIKDLPKDAAEDLDKIIGILEKDNLLDNTCYAKADTDGRKKISIQAMVKIFDDVIVDYQTAYEAALQKESSFQSSSVPAVKDKEMEALATSNLINNAENSTSPSDEKYKNFDELPKLRLQVGANTRNQNDKREAKRRLLDV